MHTYGCLILMYGRGQQYCEAIFLQLKIIKKKKKTNYRTKKNDVAHIHLLTRKATYSKVGKKQVTKQFNYKIKFWKKNIGDEKSVISQRTIYDFFLFIFIFYFSITNLHKLHKIHICNSHSSLQISEKVQTQSIAHHALLYS